MLFSRCCVFLLVFVYVDTVFSILTHEDRGVEFSAKSKGTRSNNNLVLLGLNDTRTNITVTFDEKGNDGTDIHRDKKPRTFFGPLSLDFREKLNPKRGIIYDTRDSYSGIFNGGSSCCGSGYYGSSSYPSRRPDYSFGSSSGSRRYPSRVSGNSGDRRRPSLSYPFGLSGFDGDERPGGGGGGGGGGSFPNRYGPSASGYDGIGNDEGYSFHNRPGASSRPHFNVGSGNGPGSFGGGSSGSYGGSRPGSYEGGGGPGSYGGGGPSVYGGGGPGSGHAGGYGGYGGGWQSGPGDNRPGGGAYGNFGGNRPGGYDDDGFNGNSFGGGIGVHGTFGSPEGFGGGGDYGYGAGGIKEQSSSTALQTQKALALKALAGVALIGAAAALATNPVLLPLGVASGRRKRSVAEDFLNEHPLELLKNYITQAPTSNVSREDIARLGRFLASRKCMARLTCEVERDYLAEIALYKKIGNGDSSIYRALERRFMDLVQNNVLNNIRINEQMQREIGFALVVGSKNGDCSIFTCALPKNSTTGMDSTSA